MFMKNVCAVLVSACLCAAVFVSPAMAEELSAAKRQEILRLVEALGGKELIQQCVRQNMGLVKQLRPDIPSEQMPAVEREITALVTEKIAAPGGLAEQVLPVFAKHFTPKEMRELAAFYESPVGRKAVAVMPGALREAKDVAQRMAIGMIPEISQRVNETVQRESRRGAGHSGAQSNQL
jgi:hypothetical protein